MADSNKDEREVRQNPHSILPGALGESISRQRQTPQGRQGKHNFVPGENADIANRDRPWQSLHGRQPQRSTDRESRQALRQPVDLTSEVNCYGCAGCVEGVPCPLTFSRSG